MLLSEASKIGYPIMLKAASGGGGRGKPEEREIFMIQEDLRNGFISVEKARSDYGVSVLDTGLVVTRKD